MGENWVVDIYRFLAVLLNYYINHRECLWHGKSVFLISY